LAAGLVPRAAASGSFQADRGGAGAMMAGRHDRAGSTGARRFTPRSGDRPSGGSHRGGEVGRIGGGRRGLAKGA